MNRVTLMGNIGREPEGKRTQTGLFVLSSSVATNERVKKGDTWGDHTEWHNITVFGKRAEGLAKVLARGSKVLVEGPIRHEKYTGRDGTEKRYTKVLADVVELCGRGNGTGPQRNSPPPTEDEVTGREPGFDEDDVPF